METQIIQICHKPSHPSIISAKVFENVSIDFNTDEDQDKI